MMTQHIQRLTSPSGQVATFSYTLAKERGWDVRAEIDNELVALRHFDDWQSVEWMRGWLLTRLYH